VVSVILVYLGFYLLLGFFVYGFLPTLFSDIRAFTRELPRYLSKLETQLESLYQTPWASQPTIMQKLPTWTNAVTHADLHATGTTTKKTGKTVAQKTVIVVVGDAPVSPEVIRNTVQNLSNNAPGGQLKGTAIGQATLEVRHYTKSLMDYLFDFGKMTIESCLYTITALVLVFYLLMDGDVLKEGLFHLLPVPWRDGTRHYMEQVHGVLYYFIQGQVILGLIAGTGMWLVCVWFDIHYAFLLAVVFGVASVIPVIGPWFGIIPAVLVSAFSGGGIGIWPGWAAVLIYAGFYYLVKLYWLVPRWFKNRLEIHPIVIILSFLACMKAANLFGFLMAYPLASLISGTHHYLLERTRTATE